MRIDHHAYQRAARVASFGLLLQFVIGLILLVFGLNLNDTAFVFGSMYTLSGLVVWLGLIVIFYQHKLECLEALEEDELASSRGSSAISMFEKQDDELHVAARRLRMMHKWLMPIASLALAALLGLLAWLMLRFMTNLTGDVENARDFLKTVNRGWGISLCLGASVAAFIFSRFVAGMAKQTAWQNLRGGAAYMVGTSLLCLTIAIGIGFRFFDKAAVIEGIGYAIPVFMILLAIEIVLNFILNLYRPRIPGEVPRPAFDSKILSLLAAPDNLVRSLNEAVNYQFGFDVTSTWGYQLLLRSFIWLIAIAVTSMILLNTMVVVEPHQQAVKFSGGQIVGGVHESGILWKLPWPFQTAEVHDVSRIRTLYLTGRQLRMSMPLAQWGNTSRVNVWTESLEGKTDVKLIPFIVGASRIQVDQVDPEYFSTKVTGGEVTEVVNEDASSLYSLVLAQIILEYRIKKDGGLLDYLRFAPETRDRRKSLDDRELTLQALALSEVNDYLAQLSLDEVLALGDTSLSLELKSRIQTSFDELNSGVEVVAVSLPTMRPIEGTEGAFEELGISREARRQAMATTNQIVSRTQIFDLGSPEYLDPVLNGITEWERLKRDLGPDARETIAQRQVVENLLLQGGGITAQTIAMAENERWIRVLESRTKASRVRGQIPAYRAAPELYRQREIMKVLIGSLTFNRKYFVGIDPARVSIDLELKELNPILNFADSLLREGEVADE
ncbi:MAG: hypothetical protein IID30_03775 [Planctomycetes bacterium]|nr:hypothetical protein [Planctomycetota bacterium]